MIAIEESVALLLCAGLSRRFGPGNKLLAPLEGRPLIAHAASLCMALPFAGRIAVVPPDEPELRALLDGFELVENPAPEAGQDSSLRLGLARGLDAGANAVLVLLGDMPHVDSAHLLALAAAAGEDRAAISLAGEVRMPPTLFPARLAQHALAAFDRPVRESLGQPVVVAAKAGILADYDRPEDWAGSD